MIGTNIQLMEQGGEKSHLKTTEHPLAGTPITTKTDNAVQQRLTQREALKAFRLTRDPNASFGIDMGDGTQVKDKRPLPKDATDRIYETAKTEKANDQSAQMQKATTALIENAEQRFGAEKVKALHIAKDDLGSALAALAFGPDICNKLGKEETQSLGKRFLVFGIAPMFGMADEARKQFTQHTLETAHAGAGNYLSGAAIGALLEHVHPAVLAATIVGGGTMFVKDQLSSPEHRARNREISDISRKLDSASNADLMTLMGKSKSLLGPDLYKGTFDLVTGTPALPDGPVVKAAVKEQALALSKIDVMDGIKVLQNLGHAAWDTLKPIFEKPTLKPAFAGAAYDFHPSTLVHQLDGASKLQDNILRMQATAVKASPSQLEVVRAAIADIAKKPIAENLDSVVKANTELLKSSRSPVTTKDQAHALSILEDKFIDHMQAVRHEFTSLRPQAEAIQAKPEQSASEEKLVEKFYAAEDTLYQVVTDRLKTLYGWNEHVGAGTDSGIYTSSGMGTQRRVANNISGLLNRGLDKDPVIQSVLKANGVPLERAKEWVGMPITGASGADHAGCDYLLANKHTGEIYTLDITERASNMKRGSLVESRLTNLDLQFPNKDIANERKHLVIGVTDEVTKDNAIFAMKNALNITPAEARKLIAQEEKKQLAEIIGKTISQPSKLNLLETPLPSAIANAPESRQAYELWRFRTSLEKVGYSDWARSINRSIGYIRANCAGLPHFE